MGIDQRTWNSGFCRTWEWRNIQEMANNKNRNGRKPRRYNNSCMREIGRKYWNTRIGINKWKRLCRKEKEYLVRQRKKMKLVERCMIMNYNIGHDSIINWGPNLSYICLVLPRMRSRLVQLDCSYHLKSWLNEIRSELEVEDFRVYLQIWL